ncbi:cell division protein ZapA [Hydrogenophaga taeniospiralis]|uniref:cell division protein ZapA n=1 Tax=Hydrogenophaga taeniospiralis TaxID=65656 RepID=UPI001CFB4E8D|nr:cell division protein ZapA [Hydrogenophaga taeniospiralis]UCU92085.1 cell division protein ZapA [Hydrogenophaga taeniospiralis]
MNKPASKQIEVQIMGQSYLLACPVGGESALLDAVERVDTAMCRIRDAGKMKARDRIAVLASLNLAFELSQKESQHFEQAVFGHTESGALTEPSPTLGNADNDPAAQARMDELIRRLDQTLGSDGQLL